MHQNATTERPVSLGPYRIRSIRNEQRLCAKSSGPRRGHFGRPRSGAIPDQLRKRAYRTGRMPCVRARMDSPRACRGTARLFERHLNLCITGPVFVALKRVQSELDWHYNSALAGSNFLDPRRLFGFNDEYE